MNVSIMPFEVYISLVLGGHCYIKVVLDPAFADLFPQEGLVGTSHSRPRGDDILEGLPIADSQPPIVDSRPPTPSWDQ